MPQEEVTTVSEIKTTSDGNVTISIETYNELLRKAALKPPVINRTTINKTPEMVAKELKTWGVSFMGLGGAMFTLGAFLYRSGRNAV